MIHVPCTVCGRSNIQLRGTDPTTGERFCSNCWSYRVLGDCDHCGRHRRIAGLDPDGRSWCPTCQSAARTQRRDLEARTRIVEAVCEADPTADLSDVAELLTSFAAHNRTLRRIDRHLVKNPRVFHDGPTHAHYTVGRFVEALAGAGVKITASYLDCEDCGRNLITARSGNKMICKSCANKSRASECCGCGRVQIVAARDADGRAVCARCLEFPGWHATRRTLTKQIVDTVSAMNIDIEADVVVAALDSASFTTPGLTSLLTHLASEPDLAESTHRHKSSRKFAAELRSKGVNVASAVPPRTRRRVDHRCPVCERPSVAVITTQCRACTAEQIAARTTNCGACDRPTRDAIGGFCGRCHRWATRACDSCDVTMDLVQLEKTRRCHRCLLAEELDAMTGSDPAEWVVVVAEAIRSAKSVAATRKWLAESPGGSLLRKLAAGEIELSHTELDHRSGRSVERLRGLLIVAGALAIDERGLARLEETLKPITETISEPADRRIVESYIRWQALPRIRRRAEQGRSIVHSAGNLRQRATVITRFVATLHAENKTLATCQQRDIDSWFAAPGAMPSVARSFMTWALKRRHLQPGLDLPGERRSRQPTTPVDQQLRWANARRLINDDEFLPDDRVAGALVVLYGQPNTRISALTISDVITSDTGEVTIDFGTHQIDLTEPFARLVKQLPVRRLAGTADHLETRWLFPSRRPDRPAHPTTIAARLKRIGIETRSSRLAAISQLATEIPPALLAESIGISPKQAAKWVGISGGNWSSYTRN